MRKGGLFHGLAAIRWLQLLSWGRAEPLADPFSYVEADGQPIGLAAWNASPAATSLLAGAFGPRGNFPGSRRPRSRGPRPQLVGAMPKTIIVGPCYNDEKRRDIKGCRRFLTGPETELLFVNDESKAGTPMVLAALCERLVAHGPTSGEWTQT